MGTNYYFIPTHMRAAIIEKYFDSEQQDDWTEHDDVIHIGKKVCAAGGPLFIWSILPDTLEELAKDHVIWSEGHFKDDGDVTFPVFQKHVLKGCQYFHDYYALFVL